MTIESILPAKHTINEIHISSIAISVTAAILWYWTISTLYCLFFHPLRNVPGPFLAKVSQLWRNYRYFRGTWHDDAIDIHEKYGRLVRIAPNEVSFVDEHGLKALYGHGKQIKKTEWYDVWKVPGMTVSFFAATDFKTHRHLRSRVQGAYSMTSLLTMEPLLQEVLDTNWSRLREFAQTGKNIPIDKWANYFTFDVIGQLAMGGTIGFLEQGEDVSGIIQSIHDGFWLMSNMGNMPLQMFWFNNKLIKRITRLLGIERLNAFDKFVDWLDMRVETRMTEESLVPKKDMLQHFIEAKDEEKKPVKKADVMIEGVNILGAGADTTAIGILAVLGSLLKNPAYVTRLQKEVDEAYQNLGLNENGKEIMFMDAQKLPWLSAIVKESTRLHPSIQYQLPRYVPRGGVQIGTQYIPDRTICSISATSTNRSKDVFGADACEFRPERWMAQNNEDEERIKRANTFLVTFGMGSRSCVGRNLATIEMFKYIAQFFHEFDAELVNKDLPWKTKSQWFAFQRDFEIRIKSRETKSGSEPTKE